MARTHARIDPWRLFLGLHLHSDSRWSSGRNVLCQVGHLGLSDGQRRLHHFDTRCCQHQLHRRPRRAVHRRTRSRTIQFHFRIVLIPNFKKIKLFRACLFQPFTSCCRDGPHRKIVTSSHRSPTQVTTNEILN